MNKKRVYANLLILFSILLIIGCSCSFFLFNNNDKVKNDDNDLFLNTEMSESELKKFEQLATNYMFLAEYFPFESVSAIPNQYLLRIGIDGVDTSASDVEKVVSKYFGSQIKLKHEDYICTYDNEVYFDYDEESQTYLVAPSISSIHSHEGSYNVPLKMRYVHADNGYIKDEEYILNTRILYVCDIDPVIGDFYSSYNDCVNENSTPAIVNTEHSIPNASYVEVYGEKLPVTTFTFYMDNGNYILKSVSINNNN